MKNVIAPRRLLVIWPTGRCNLQCSYCYAAATSAAEMEFATAARAIDLLADKPLKIQFAGGEPLLNLPLIKQVLAYASTKCADTLFAIQTNGTLLDDDIISLFKQYQVAIGISLDGKPELNQRLRGGTKATAAGIRLLREHGLNVNLNTVVSAANVAKLNDLLDLAIYFGNVRGIGLDLLRRAGRAAVAKPAVITADAESLRAGLIKLYRYQQKINAIYPRPIVVREFAKARVLLNSKKPARDYCYATQGESYIVLPSGDCYPCGSLAADEQYFMGNIYSAVKPLALPCSRPPECVGCRYADFCPGGCPARGLLVGGFDELDCIMKKTAFELLEEDI